MRPPPEPPARPCRAPATLTTVATQDGLTVGVVAARAGVTVRALHHWDRIGLVSPSRRSSGGYRLYTAEDLTRVVRVAAYRELGMPLEEIDRLLAAPTEDGTESLREQRDRLRSRAEALHRAADRLDRLVRARDRGILLSEQEQRELFGSDWDPAGVERARQTWGQSEQWAQYAERGAERTPAQWQELARQAEALHTELAEACRTGVSPESAEAMALAERHRVSMEAYFDCPHHRHVALGRMYACGEWAEYFDAREPGLSGWLAQAVEANAAAHGVDPATATWD